MTLPPGSVPEVAYVWKTEEKGSDVNLGVHLVRDAFRQVFDIAAMLCQLPDPVPVPGKRPISKRRTGSRGIENARLNCPGSPARGFRGR